MHFRAVESADAPRFVVSTTETPLSHPPSQSGPERFLTAYTTAQQPIISNLSGDDNLDKTFPDKSSDDALVIFTRTKMITKTAGMVTVACLLCATSTDAFLRPPAGVRGVAKRAETHVPTRLERSASYSSEDSRVAVPTRTAAKPRATTFGWSKTAAARPRPQRADWSKLFATPEPKAIQGMPLVGLRRSFGDVASRSCYTLPMLFGMLSLMSTFSPMVAVQTMLAWGLGRITYWLSMRGADVSVRVPAGFVGYASLFMMAGGLVFLNGLKGISSL